MCSSDIENKILNLDLCKINRLYVGGGELKETNQTRLSCSVFNKMIDLFILIKYTSEVGVLHRYVDICTHTSQHQDFTVKFLFYFHICKLPLALSGAPRCSPDGRPTPSWTTCFFF